MTADIRHAPASTAEIRTPQRLHELLTKTSRTFALNIPLLDEPTRCEVTVAYLLFRVADTLEDSTAWSRERKLQELDRFSALLHDPSPAAAERLAQSWTADPPLDHRGYMELLGELAWVMEVHATLSPAAQRVIVDHTLRTVEGMAGFVARGSDHELRLRDVADLKDYCYAVAGIVGEMLTELFLARCDGLDDRATELRRLAPAFGEALQLVNILKDAAWDNDEGRHFLPQNTDPAGVFALAREDMRLAASYVAELTAAHAPRGIVAFCALPLLLAHATIDRVERQGPGSKITRDDVARIVGDLERALEGGDVPSLFHRF